MDTDHIFCGICGKADPVSLLRHIRDEHGITPDVYRSRCPNAPLFTPGFGDYLAANRIQVVDGAVKAVRELFGVETVCNAVAREHVPVLDARFAFDPELGKAVLSSLVDNDRILLVGPTGSGKSSLIAQLAARLNWPLRSVNLHGETSVSDFLGVHKARNGEVFFQHGIL
ncbi:MAG: AAA family ATPase, partial [Planctomycetota bacterium]|nr:AAA family ATPase [Planctomycetota bacterium]